MTIRSSVAVLVTLTIFATTGCSKLKEAKDSAVEKAAQKILESSTGAKVDRKDGEIKISLGEKESLHSLSISLKSADKKNSIKNTLILPGASLLSAIRGIKKNTLHLKANLSLKEVEAGYARMFTEKGYKDNGSLILNGLYTGRWKNPESGSETMIYAYHDGKTARLSVVYPNEL